MKRVVVMTMMGFFSHGVMFAQSAAEQDTSELSNVLKIEVVDGDTLYNSDLDPIYVHSPYAGPSAKEIQRYNRLVRNVKKAYPYAIIAKNKLNEMALHYETLHSEREKKKYISQVEKEMMAQFEGQLKQLTTSQGLILIKLIDRETGNTSYALVKELKGSFTAFFWQGIARVFGLSLKTKYDPTGADKEIEDIVQKIEKGEL